MNRLSEKGISYIGAFFMLIAFGIGGMFLSGIISIPILVAMTGKSLGYITANMEEIISNPVYFRQMQVVQTVTAILGFLIPTIFTASRLSSKPVDLTGLKGKIDTRQLVLAILIITAALGLSASLGYFTYRLPFPESWRTIFDALEENYAKTAAGLVNLDNIRELIISIIVLAFIPAVCEEVFFRGGLQNYLYRNTGKLWMSVLVVSVIFSAVHFSVYGFLSRVALGIILGLLFHYSGKLWLNILAHFINNATAVVMMYQQKAGGKPIEEILNDRDGSYLGFLTIPLIMLLFIVYRKYSSEKTISADGI